MSEHLHTLLTSGIKALNLDISDEVQLALLEYVALLAKWNKAYNLTAVRDPADMIDRHIIDSLSIVPWVSGKRIADVGTGAGLPGVVLALLKPESTFVLIDSNGKKTRFLAEVKRHLKLDNVEIIRGRVEELNCEPFDLITSRAFADAKLIVEQTHHVLAVDGKLLMMKAEINPQEYQKLPHGFQQEAVYPLVLPERVVPERADSISGVPNSRINSDRQTNQPLNVAGNTQRHCVIVSRSALSGH